MEVNLDRDTKERPTGVQMAPLSLWFQRNPATREAAGGKLQRAGKLVMSANHAIKVMVSGVEHAAAGSSLAQPPAEAPT